MPSDKIYPIIRVELPYIPPKFRAGAATYSQIAARLQVSLQRLHLDRMGFPIMQIRSLSWLRSIQLKTPNEHGACELLNRSTVHVPWVVIRALPTLKAVSFNEEKNDRYAGNEELAVDLQYVVKG